MKCCSSIQYIIRCISNDASPYCTLYVTVGQSVDNDGENEHDCRICIFVLIYFQFLINIVVTMVYFVLFVCKYMYKYCCLEDVGVRLSYLNSCWDSEAAAVREGSLCWNPSLFTSHQVFITPFP